MPRKKILRFPRLADADGNPITLSRTEQFEHRIAQGDVPRGYEKLTKKWKRVAREIASGESVHDVCEKHGVGVPTFYRRRRAHPLFRTFLYRCYLRATEDLELKLEGQTHRAAHIVEEAMESQDPYFRYDVARDVLKGRGRWAQKVKSEQDVKGSIVHDVRVDDGGLSRKEMKTLVEGLIHSLGSGIAAPHIIDVEPEPPKELPSGASSEISKA